MMNHRLPPLNALRAFEATARHLSVKSAADELCVTPGAVSQMLKALELHLGVTLFRRGNRAIFLTEAGQSYLPPVRNAFRQIAEATRRITEPSGTRTLTVSLTPFFATVWLIPRLHAFHDAHPDIDLRIITGNALANFSHDGVDVAVRHGLGHYPGLRSHRVLVVEVLPVAAAALVAARGIPANPGDLTRWPLVHDADRQGWHLWFQAQGIAAIPSARGASFDDPGLLLTAVLNGQGAGLLPAGLVAPDVREGRLVPLAGIAWLEDFAYFLVYPEANHDRPNVTAFRAWILKAAAREPNPGHADVPISPASAD
ncbi:MAG TPA: transcriptional regulator GcvA [Rhodopila sp.]|jgi:LysR family glycine cleavage system transcriptional activator